MIRGLWIDMFEDHISEAEAMQEGQKGRCDSRTVADQADGWAITEVYCGGLFMAWQVFFTD